MHKLGRLFRIVITFIILVVSSDSCDGVFNSNTINQRPKPLFSLVQEIPYLTYIVASGVGYSDNQGYHTYDNLALYYSDEEPLSAEDLVKNGKLLPDSCYRIDDGWNVHILISNFKPSTTYYLVLRGTIHGKDIYSDIFPFRFLGEDDLVIEHHEAKAVSTHSITVGATIKRKDGIPLGGRCVFLLWEDEDTPGEPIQGEKNQTTFPGLVYPDGFDVGEYEYVFGELLYNTTYYFRFNIFFTLRYLGEDLSTVIECHDVKSATTDCNDLVPLTQDAICEGPFQVKLNGHFSFDGNILYSLHRGAHFGFVYGSEELDALSLYEKGEITTWLDSPDPYSGDYSADVNWYAGRTMYYAAFLLIPSYEDPYYEDLFMGEVKSITTDDLHYMTEAVDLGLPSGIQWNNVNLGAESEHLFGPWYLWGDVWSSMEDFYSGRGDLNKWLGQYKVYSGPESCYYYKYYDYPDTILKYNSNPEYGPVDNKQVLDLEDDPANFRLGGNWRTPTKKDFEELFDNCDITVLESGDYIDLKLTSRINGNSIILPMTLVPGMYGGDNLMTSSLCPDNSINAYGLRTDLQRNDSDELEVKCEFIETDRKNYCSTVRPVLYPSL